jgi:hypothetical protein
MMIHSEEAFEFTVGHLATLHEAKDHRGYRAGEHDCDVWVPSLAWSYWSSRIDNRERRYHSSSDLEQPHVIPFYDAVWELCRIGVLRSGEFAPMGMTMHGSSDRYTITSFGWKWLREASQRPIIDPSRLAEVLQGFTPRFGGGYAQRSTEAVRCYRTANYLSTCVMAGAAGESVLLAIAIARSGDEGKVLAEYKTGNGRSRVTKGIIGSVSASTASQFQAGLQVLHYWRDDAGHGTMTPIGEIEAHASLTQLLRLAQFTSTHWGELTDSTV